MRGSFRRDRHQHLIDDFGARLRAELKMRRHAPDGKEHTPTAYVFGDACGWKVGSIRRAWDTANLYAHGHTPVWIGKGKLAPESRAALKTINLHFHDLRRQFACTLLRLRLVCR